MAGNRTVLPVRGHRRLAIGWLLAAFLLSGGGIAPSKSEEGPCEGFKWPLGTEMTWLQMPATTAVATGATLRGLPDHAISLALKRSGSQALPVVSGARALSAGPDTFSGWFTVEEIPKAGLYQVSLSHEGWIDVAQNGKLVESTDFTGRRKCDVLRKSVRYDLVQGGALIQIVGVPVETVKVTIREAQ